MTLTQDQIQRYSRHVLLPQVGGEGQVRLLDSSILIAFAPQARGAAETLAAYLAAAGVGRIGWWAPGGSAHAPGSLAGLLGTYSPEGPEAAIRAINPDARLEKVGSLEEAKQRGDFLVLLLGGDAGLEAFGGICRDAGKMVVRGRLSGVSGAVLGIGPLGHGSEPAGGMDADIPPAPAEGALGALLAAAAIRVLLGIAPAGSAGFDFERGRLWGCLVSPA